MGVDRNIFTYKKENVKIFFVQLHLVYDHGTIKIVAFSAILHVFTKQNNQKQWHLIFNQY